MKKSLIFKYSYVYKLSVVIFLSSIVMFGFSNLVSSAQNNLLKITKSKLGNGSGIVKMESVGVKDIICKFNKKADSSCSGSYPKGVNVTVTATADSGSTFTGWGVACSGTNPVCTVTLDKNNKDVTAFFNLGDSSSSSPDGSGGPYTLTLERGGSGGSGVVEIVDASKTCFMRGEFTSCSYTYSSGTSVALRAVPDSGMTLSWSGACSGSNPDCNITMNNNKTAIADFTPSGDPAPKINFFYADPSAVKTGGTSILHGQATNVSRCAVRSLQDSSLGNYGCPNPEIYQCNSDTPSWYWKNVSDNFTLSVNLNKEGTYNYDLICRGKGSYDNNLWSSGLTAKYISVSVMNNVTLNVGTIGNGGDTVKSNTYAPSFAWANNGLVKGEPRYTGNSTYSYVKTHSCNSLTVGSKVYDGSGRGPSYGDIGGDAFPVYDGLKTATAREYTNSKSLGLRSGGTVSEWQCKDKDFDIDCGVMCSASYAFGDNKKIILTASPSSGSSFSKWTGVSCGEGSNNKNTCTVTMDGTKNVNAEFIVCATCVSSSSSSGPTVTMFSYTGAEQTYKVPAGVTSVKITASGAQGQGGYGGYGGKTSATVNVTSGETLYIYVGGMSGYNGGGLGNRYGGGASDIRQSGKALSNRIIVAGGGGGSGAVNRGGAGGGLTGAGGQGPYAGGGASQVSGGIGGGCYGELCGGAGRTPGLPGGFGVGGIGANEGGGGGGGYYGGGGGGDSWQDGDQTSGGGGGSSYVDSKATNTSTESGVNYGSGEVTITTN